MKGKSKKLSLLFLIAAVLMIQTVCYAASSEADYEKRAKEIMRTMSWKEKVGQMFLVAAPSGNTALTEQKKYQFGGYVFFATEFASRTPAQEKTRIASIQDVSKIPMLMSVDEEGGTVTRVSYYRQYRASRFASPRAVFNAGGWTGIANDTNQKCKLLRSIGLNTNLAPVADVAYNSGNFIYQRSFSTNATDVSTFIDKTVTAMKKKKVVSCLKHFPGYGNNGDTHTNIIRDYRSKSTFKKRDLLPFKAGIKAGCDMIMVSHNIVNCFDKTLPASLSPKVVGYLRNTLKYDGVIVTDSLSMAGVSGYAGNSRAQTAVKAVLAGNDLLCTIYYNQEYLGVYNAVKNGTIPKSRINESVKRILMMKLRRGILK